MHVFPYFRIFTIYTVCIIIILWQKYTHCNYTYLVLGYDNNRHNFSEKECLNMISYIKTRFFRYLVSLKKKTQDNPRDVFQFVPIQDFSKSWTDDELYKKYHLTQAEIEYIESLIKPLI